MKYFIISFLESKILEQRGNPVAYLDKLRKENKMGKQEMPKSQFAYFANNFFFHLRISLVHYRYDNYQ